MNDLYAGDVRDVANGYPALSVAQGAEEAFWIRKSPAGLQSNPLQFGFGAGMTRAWYEWVGGQLTGQSGSQKFGLLRLDASGRAVRQLNLSADLLHLSLPEIDRSRDDGSQLSFGIQLQESAPPSLISGAKEAVPAGPVQNQKRVLLANTVLNIQGMESATRQALFIGSLTLQRAVGAGIVGLQDVGKQPFVASNLVIRVPESAARSLYAWYEGSVLQGKSVELPGVIEYRNADMSTVIASVDLINIGMVRLTPLDTQTMDMRGTLVEVELYVEQVIPRLENLAAPRS